MAEPLDKRGRAALDAALLRYLKRGPVTIFSVLAHAELHSEAEIYESLKRLRKTGVAGEVYDGRYGSCWAALSSSATTSKEIK